MPYSPRAGHIAGWVYVGAVMALMFLPIAVMLAFSFNDPEGRFNFELHRFSADAWRAPLAVPQLAAALRNSLVVALAAAFMAAALGVPLGLMLGRGYFRGKSAVAALSFAPLATPEVVLGAGLLLVFVATAGIHGLRASVGDLLFPLGIRTVVIAHATLGLPFVIINVRARVAAADPALADAARDLGASGAVVFWTIWWPMILPGLVSGALMVFVVSLDDFVLTNFTAGRVVMFPTWLYGLMHRALPAQISVIGFSMFVISVSLMLIATWWESRDDRQQRTLGS